MMMRSKSVLKQSLKASLFALALSFSFASHAVENTIIKDKLSLQSYLLQERVTAGLKTKTLKVDDIVWSYNEGGAVDKPTILLIHGFAGNRDNWNRVAQFLTPYYHVVIPDLPTNGDTKVPDDFDISMPNVTERLRRFVEAIHIQDKLNVAGHSIGGSIATLYAAQYPFDTQSLFLLNSMVNWGLNLLGREKMSFSKKIKAKFKDAVKFINSFEDTAAELAIENGYHYVVCGHIHQPEKRNILAEGGEVMYLNSGDWVENLTALEYNHGQWEVFKYEAKNFVKDEVELGELSDGEDLHGKLDVNILLQKIKLGIG